MLRVVGAHLRSRYKESLKPFIDDVFVFDRLVKTHGAVISGSVALRFFLPEETWESGDLDVYLPNTTFDKFIVAITDADGLAFELIPRKVCRGGLVDTEGAGIDDETAAQDKNSALDNAAVQDAGVVTSEEDDTARRGIATADEPTMGVEHGTPSRSAGIVDVRSFRTRTGGRVDVIRAPLNNPLVSINRFWSSLLMNFLRPDACVCGYPKTTLARVGLLKPGLTPRDMKAMQKYERRGFQLVEDGWQDGADYWDSLFFGRRKTMVTPFRVDLREEYPRLPLALTECGRLLTCTWPWIVGKWSWKINE